MDIENLTELSNSLGIPVVKVGTGYLLQHFIRNDIGYSLDSEQNVIGLAFWRSRSISEIPSLMSSFKKLAYLNLSNNRIRDISLLGELKELQYIDLSYNHVKDISPLKNLKFLQYLDIAENTVEQLSSIKHLFFKTKFIFHLERNPIKTPPIEICSRGKNAIANYFEQIISETDYLFEAKLLLVGEERAGKTTIIQALTKVNFKIDLNQSTTRGIEVSQWTIPKEKINIYRDFRFNVWDFGGQEIYHSTHQFFLTKRSLYLFVTEARKDLRFDDFYYWLNIINTLAGTSPVILVQNKTDQDHKSQSIDEYRILFPQIVSDIVKISCNTEHEDWDNIYKPKLELLKEEIYKILKDNRLEGIGDELPKSWIDIRLKIKELQDQNINYISISDYLDICKKHGLSHTQAIHLSDYFHDLGVLLHFKNDIQLNRILFINHDWVTKAIYKVFDDNKVKENHGRFTDNDLIRIWEEPQFIDKQAELINLMKNPQFGICYQHEYGHYLSPQLFNNKPINYEWRNNLKNLHYHFEYEFMPKGILSQLIVVLHKYIYKDTFWLYGVLFQYKNSRAIVKENRFGKKNLITIQIEGIEAKEFLTIINYHIRLINCEYTNLLISEMLGCICSECENNESKYLFKLELINRAIIKRKTTVECQISFQNIEISALLGSYMPNDKVLQHLQSPTANFLKDGISTIIANTEELLVDNRFIKTLLNENYEYLINLDKNKPNIDEIEKVISNNLFESQTERSEFIINEIIKFIITAFVEFDKEMDDKLKEIIMEIQNTDNWETKVKLGIPLLNLTGLSIETEFNLSKFIKKLLNK